MTNPTNDAPNSADDPRYPADLDLQRDAVAPPPPPAGPSEPIPPVTAEPDAVRDVDSSVQPATAPPVVDVDPARVDPASSADVVAPPVEPVPQPGPFDDASVPTAQGGSTPGAAVGAPVGTVPVEPVVSTTPAPMFVASPAVDEPDDTNDTTRVHDQWHVYRRRSDGSQYLVFAGDAALLEKENPAMAATVLTEAEPDSDRLEGAHP